MNKKTNTSRIWLNSILLLFIVTFLTMQWATPHAHLPSQHHHDGNHHQHQSEIHTHQLIDVRDTLHHVSFVNVIEFNTSDCLPTNEKQKIPFIILASTPSYSLPSLSQFHIKIPVITKAKQSYLDLSTAHPRAPPSTA